MTINLVTFGYGLGLVLVGWIAGLSVGFVFSIVEKVGTLGR